MSKMRLTAFALAAACAALAAACAVSAAASCRSLADEGAATAAAEGRGIVSETDPDGSAETGKVYGEFEDFGLYARAVAKRPRMAGWNDKQAWDGLSGATIMSKTMGPGVPDRSVLLDGEILAYADGFGQFWFSLPPGAYTIVGHCEGYRDASVRIEVKAGTSTYANFYLKKP